MLHSRTLYKTKRRFYRFTWQFVTCLLACLACFNANAQNCPPNIDFERGTFDGWTCYIGSVSAASGQNVISLFPSGPVADRHTMYSANSGLVDPYGGFPVNCPNGSGHSIRLGNNMAGGQAEGVSYEFTIPANQDEYSLIYHYAVVFQDPNHQEYQQPRMEIEITNVTDNEIISCASFTFIPYGSLLPGFFLAPNPPDTTSVWCKDWSAVSINLNGKAGKTIRLFFKTADCTFVRHFGYAYIDVNSECSSEFVGATYCPDDTTVIVTAPYGYQGYTWYNSTFSQVLGTQQTITFTPPPVSGSTIAVELIPYDGYGCLDTLYALLKDTLTIKANAGRDTLSCNQNPVPIGVIPKPGVVYSWSPTSGLSNPFIANPLASPGITTTYILTTRHNGGGCLDMDSVVVGSSVINNSLQLIGSASFCVGRGDSAILRVQPADSIQWFRDGGAINGAHQQEYRVLQSGSYHALLFNEEGCSLATVKQDIVIDKPKPGITYPVQYALMNVPVTLQARQFGITAFWSPGIHLNTQASYTPVFQSSTDQLYTIEIKTNTGCLTTDTQLVKTIEKVEIFVPTAFTPNNDGLNDFLRPILIGVKELRYFKIFNRYGQVLFETRSERPGWNGSFKGVQQSTQVFVWIIEGIGIDGKTYFQKGTSVLVR